MLFVVCCCLECQTAESEPTHHSSAKKRTSDKDRILYMEKEIDSLNTQNAQLEEKLLRAHAELSDQKKLFAIQQKEVAEKAM